MAANEFYLLIGEKHDGPYSIDDIKEKLEAKRISPETLCAQNHSSEWISVGDLILKADLEEMKKAAAKKLEAKIPPIAPPRPSIHLIRSEKLGDSTCFTFGFLFSCVGFLIASVALLFMSSAEGSASVVNLDKINHKQNLIIFGVGLGLFGGILMILTALQILHRTVYNLLENQFRRDQE